jgi:tetratricopeptide (TPR) repeat protein
VAAGVTNYAYWRRAATRGLARRLAAAAVGPAAADNGAAQIAGLTRYLNQRPDDARARFQLAELYFKQNDCPRSLAELKLLERAHPHEPELFLRQAVVLKYAGQPDAAEKKVRRALAVSPRYELAWEWLGEIYLDQARYRDALTVFERCLKRKPGSFFVLMGKGRALEQLLLARHPIPIAVVLQPVEQAVQSEPDNAEALATLARMKLAYEQRLDEAESLALRAAALDPGSERPYLTLAQVALSRPPIPENLRRAGEYAYQAGRRDLRDPRPPYFIGRVFLQQNDPGRAVKALERSVALGATPEAVSQLAVAYRRAGDAKRGDQYAAIYQRYTDTLGRRNALLAAREREPVDVRHLYALADLYLEASEPDTAARWLVEAKKLRPRDPHGERLSAQVRQIRQRGSHAPLLPVP